MIQKTPDSPLDLLIEYILHFRDYMPEHSLEKVIPDGHSYLIFELDNMPRFVMDNVTLAKKWKKTKVWFSGLHTNYITINALPHSEMLVVKFRAYGTLPFITCPVAELVNKVTDAEKIFGMGVWELRDKILQTSKAEDKIDLCEKWLMQLFAPDNYPNKCIISLCNEMITSDHFEFGFISQRIEQANISKKHFVHLFKKYVGIPPKQLQRICRFNKIFSTIQKQDEIRWAQIASTCGYYDQAHFIKEFKKFCGINPSQFIADHKETDRTNFFPLDG